MILPRKLPRKSAQLKSKGEQLKNLAKKLKEIPDGDDYKDPPCKRITASFTGSGSIRLQQHHKKQDNSSTRMYTSSNEKCIAIIMGIT